jgi:hypothetical protein
MQWGKQNAAFPEETLCRFVQNAVAFVASANRSNGHCFPFPAAFFVFPAP